MLRLRSIILLVCICTMPMVSFGDNSARMKEIGTQYQQLQTQMTQHQEAIQKIQAEMLKLQGAAEELQRQDKEVKDGTAIHPKSVDTSKKK